MRNIRYKDFYLTDLSSLVNFKKWLSENIQYHKTNEIKKQHILIYLDYMMDIIQKNTEDDITKKNWIEQINKLKNRAEEADE